MTDNKPDKIAVERFHALREKRQYLLSLPPEETMARILQDPQPVALVHSFPEQDFYFLIHDIGPEDALPLLSHASNRQWEHLLDLETWQKDQIDAKAVSRWLDLFLNADPKRFIDWFLNEKLEFVEFFLYRNIEVRVREHDQDPSELGKDFFSLDNTYYMRFIDQPADGEENKRTDEQRKKFIIRLAEKLADIDHHLFQSVLLEATHVVPAEVEEECYRWRNIRLADKGFLPFDEAIGIYQVVKVQDLEHKHAKHIPQSADQALALPIPQYPIRMLPEENHFTRAMAVIETQEVLPYIQAEFANLCNQVIVADHKTIRDREELRGIVKKACGYLNIGLERLVGGKKRINPHHAAALITKHPLSQIFRVGFGGALNLKWQAEKWLDTCWFARIGLHLTFWGEQWLGVLGGLLLKKPLFYDNYKTGVLYREFACIEDIIAMEGIFNQVRAVDDMLALMPINIDRPSSYGFLTYKNLILTMWARHRLKLRRENLESLPMKKFRSFFEDLLPQPSNSSAGEMRKIPQAMKDNFLEWLALESGLHNNDITDRLGETFEKLFEDIESELGRVAVNDLDPKYVNLFLVTNS